jgi:PIN domain nuclease of toxin-antitoxin system
MKKAALRRVGRARMAGRLQVAAVTLWEVALLVQTRRLRIDVPMREWFTSALRQSDVGVVPLDASVAIEASRLLHALRDPADCQIAGSALHLGVPLATRDSAILDRADALGLDVVEV